MYVVSVSSVSVIRYDIHFPFVYSLNSLAKDSVCSRKGEAGRRRLRSSLNSEAIPARLQEDTCNVPFPAR